MSTRRVRAGCEAPKKGAKADEKNLFIRMNIKDDETVCALVAATTGRPATDLDLIIAAHALVGMALSFGVARATFLRRAGFERYDAALQDHIARVVGALAGRAVA